MNKLYIFDKDFCKKHEGIKYLLSIFVNVFLFIQLFDISRQSLKIPSIVNGLLSLLRDISIYAVAIFLLVKKKSKCPSLLYIFILLSIFIPGIIYIGNVINKDTLVPFGAVIQSELLMLRPFLFLYVLYNLGCFYIFEKKGIIKTFIVSLVLIFILSAIISVFFPGLRYKYDIENRIGLGNMSVQSGMYLCGFILCFYYFPFKENCINWFCSITLLIGILLSVCSTGILCAVCVLVLFLFDKKTRKKSFSLLLLLTIGIYFFILKYYSLFETFIDYFSSKLEDLIDLLLNSFTGESNKPVKSDSFSARDKQIEYMLLYNNKPIDYIFGHGYFSVLIQEEMIENGYYDLYFSCGIYGIIVLIFIYLKYGIKSIKFFFINHNILGLCSLLSLVLFMVTLVVHMLCPLLLSFIILFYFVFCDKDLI